MASGCVEVGRTSVPLPEAEKARQHLWKMLVSYARGVGISKPSSLSHHLAVLFSREVGLGRRFKRQLRPLGRNNHVLVTWLTTDSNRRVP